MKTKQTDPAAEHGAAHGDEDHLPEPVPRDPDLPTVSSASIAFLAAGALVVVFVALFALFG